MAQDLKEAGQDNPAIGHNAADEARIRLECAQGLRQIKAERRALNEQAQEIRERLRNNNIDVKSLEAAIRILDMKDSNARDVYVDGLRLSFEALGYGEQASMLTVFDKEYGSGEPPVEAPVKATDTPF